MTFALRRGLLVSAATRARAIYSDDFTALSDRWVASAGTLAVAGGSLQGATAGSWGLNMIANGEFTTNTTGWTGGLGGSALSRVDSEADPGVNSGGADKWAAKLADTAGSATCRAQADLTGIVAGSQIRGTCRARYNTADNRSQLYINATTQIGGAAADTWETLAVQREATTANALAIIYTLGVTVGAVAYYDAIQCYRQNSVALLSGWGLYNFTATLSHVSPAAPSVVPFGFVCRYTDASNYWEVRVLPNTAGNDLQIVQVTAGVETVRAESDIDWTAGGTDQLEVTANAATISTRHWKDGAADWTAGPSYASATQGQTDAQLGVMFYDTAAGRLSSFEVTNP